MVGWSSSRVEVVQSRFGGAEGVGVFGFGEGQIEFGQRVHGVADARRLFADQFAQFGQDAADFFFLFELQLPPGVVEFHRRQRFDEQRRAGGGLIVHDAAQFAFEFGFERDDVSPGALGDERFLQIGRIAVAIENGLQFLQKAVVGDFEVAANGGEFFGSGAEDFTALVNSAANGFDQAGAVVNAGGGEGQTRKLITQFAQGAFERAPGDDGVFDVEYFGREQNRADDGVRGERPHVSRAADGGVGFHREQFARFGRFLLPAAGFGNISRRTHGAGQRGPAGESAVRGEAVEDFWQFEGGEGFGVHARGAFYTRWASPPTPGPSPVGRIPTGEGRVR